MVHVRIAGSQPITKLEVWGHAGYADPGKDIVCSAISAVSIGILNAIEELQPGSCDIRISKDNHIRVQVKKDSAQLQTILEVGIIQYKTIQESNSDYIQIETMEGQS